MSSGPLRASWRRLLPSAAAAGVGIAAAVAVHAIRVAPYRAVLRHRRVVVPPTWPALEILHLSDLHLRRSDPALLQGQLRALSLLSRHPDVVCVTGDLCEQVADTPLVAALLRELRPRLGTYLILGNHEYGADARMGSGDQQEALIARFLRAIYGPLLSAGHQEAEAIASALAGFGFRVLRNEGVRIQVDHRSLWLAGVDSGWAGRDAVGAALAGRRANEGALVLVHEPELAFPAVERGADLVLAGHTHGGQVRVPLLGAVYWHRLDSRLEVAAGVQAIGGSQLHISAGTGQLLPLRFRCPPELVWLRCVPAVDGRSASLLAPVARTAGEAQLPALGITQAVQPAAQPVQVD